MTGPTRLAGDDVVALTGIRRLAGTWRRIRSLNGT